MDWFRDIKVWIGRRGFKLWIFLRGIEEWIGPRGIKVSSGVSKPKQASELFCLGV
jgi:hypothetical protein